jgi:hypothetical protein
MDKGPSSNSKTRQDLHFSRTYTVSHDGQFQYVSDDVVVFRSGHCIIYYTLSTKKQTALKFDSHFILDAFAVDASSQTVVCAVHKLEHQLHFFRYPNQEPFQVITCDTIFPMSHLSLSANAMWVASISSQIDRKISIWDIHSGALLVSSLIDVQGTHIERRNPLAFNPWNHSELCLIRQHSLLFWKVLPKFNSLVLESNEVYLPGVNQDQRRQGLEVDEIKLLRAMLPTTTSPLDALMPSSGKGLDLDNLDIKNPVVDGKKSKVAKNASDGNMQSPRKPKLVHKASIQHLGMEVDSSELDLRHAKTRRIFSYCWGRNGVVFCGTNLSELLVLNSAQGCLTSLDLTQSQVAASTPICSLTVTPRFVVAGTGHGQLLWLEADAIGHSLKLVATHQVFALASSVRHLSFSSNWNTAFCTTWTRAEPHSLRLVGLALTKRVIAPSEANSTLFMSSHTEKSASDVGSETSPSNVAQAQRDKERDDAWLALELQALSVQATELEEFSGARPPQGRMSHEYFLQHGGWDPDPSSAHREAEQQVTAGVKTTLEESQPDGSQVLACEFHHQRAALNARQKQPLGMLAGDLCTLLPGRMNSPRLASLLRAPNGVGSDTEGASVESAGEMAHRDVLLVRELKEHKTDKQGSHATSRVITPPSPSGREKDMHAAVQLAQIRWQLPAGEHVTCLVASAVADVLLVGCLSGRVCLLDVPAGSGGLHEDGAGNGGPKTLPASLSGVRLLFDQFVHLSAPVAAAAFSPCGKYWASLDTQGEPLVLSLLCALSLCFVSVLRLFLSLTRSPSLLLQFSSSRRSVRIQHAVTRSAGAGGCACLSAPALRADLPLPHTGVGGRSATTMD